MLAIGVLALAFPATALAAGSRPAQPTTSASTRAGGAPSRVAHARHGHSVLALGSGYSTPGGSRLVRVVQRDLDAGGYPPGQVDGLYGPRTRHAVVTFQAAHGLQVDGVVGSRTWAALDEPVLILAPGAGDQPGGENVVRSLQRHLASAGDPPGPIDGRYGILTEGAVRRFQQAHGLPVTGTAGPRTLARLTTPAPSVRRSNPPPRQPAPAATRSHRNSRPTSSVAPAPRQRPVNAGREVPPGSAHRARPGSLPWMIILAGLALALALVLAARLLIASLRDTPSRSQARSAVAESDAKSATLEHTGLPTTNGDHQPVARPNGTQIHTNGHRAIPSAGNGNDANSLLSHGKGDDFPETAETAGAFNLGQPPAGHEGVVKAHAANGHADPRDHGTAASNLGRLLEEQGALAEAEAAYRHADELGDSAGAFHLGLLLESQGGVVEAQAAYSRADQRGHGTAASNLGRLLEQQGALAEAEAAYRRADQRGEADGAFRLGVLLKRHGALDEAAAAHDRATGRGHIAAAVELGVLLAEYGALAEAETAFRRADERGDAAAAFNLGVLLQKRGALADAETAFRRADERGDAIASFNLGLLLAEQGALPEAIAAFRRADERGDAAAAFNLGVLLEDRGALDEAEAAYRRAEQRDDGECADMARAVLLDLWQT